MSDEPRLVRFLIGSGSIEELLERRREEERAAVEDRNVDHDDDEAD